MSEQHFYADVNLPFHVWVRERAGSRGYRWVLRDASEVKEAANVVHAAADGGTAARCPGAPLQVRRAG